VISNIVLISTIRDILSGRTKIAAISLDELVSSKSPHNKNSLNCSTALVNFVEDENTYVYKVVCSEKSSDQAGHKVSIQLQQDPTEAEDKKNLQVKVNCDCPAFLYQGGQFNLSERDALLGNPRGQLVPPKVRDPVRVNYGCKHVFAAVRRLLDKFRFEKPTKPEPIEKIAPEDEEFLEKPTSKPPFGEEEVLPEKPGIKKPEIVFERKEVPSLLLPTDIDTKAVEEMEEEVIPRVPGVPKLFEQEESPEEAFSTFRPKKPAFGQEEPEEIPQEEEPEVLETKKPQLPFSPPKYQLTPKHFDKAEDEDLDEATQKREENRLKRKNKVKSLLGFENPEEAGV